MSDVELEFEATKRALVELQGVIPERIAAALNKDMEVRLLSFRKALRDIATMDNAEEMRAVAWDALG